MNNPIHHCLCAALLGLSIGSALAEPAPSAQALAATSDAAMAVAEDGHRPLPSDAASSALALMGVAVLLGARHFRR